MTCKRCGKLLEVTDKFCQECGEAVPQTKQCVNRNCGVELPLKAKFCSECGTRQDGIAASGLGLAIGEKNVIAGDVIGKKEETHVTGNATIIKNEDETKKTAKCHVCGKMMIVVDGYVCNECNQFTCSSCFNREERCCYKCSPIEEETINLEEYIQQIEENLDNRDLDQVKVQLQEAKNHFPKSNMLLLFEALVKIIQYKETAEEEFYEQGKKIVQEIGKLECDIERSWYSVIQRFFHHDEGESDIKKSRYKAEGLQWAVVNKIFLVIFGKKNKMLSGLVDCGVNVSKGRIYWKSYDIEVKN